MCNTVQTNTCVGLTCENDGWQIRRVYYDCGGNVHVILGNNGCGARNGCNRCGNTGNATGCNTQNGDYYARQYGLYPYGGCGCG